MARQHLVVGVDLLLQLVDGVLRDVLVLAAVRHGVTETLHGVLDRPDQQQHTRASRVSTPLPWIFKNAICKQLFTHVRITCTRSESARERRIALYKSDQQQHNNLVVVVVVIVIHSFYVQLPLAKRVRRRVSLGFLKPWQPNRVSYIRTDAGYVCGGGGGGDERL